MVRSSSRDRTEGERNATPSSALWDAGRPGELQSRSREGTVRTQMALEAGAGGLSRSNSQRHARNDSTGTGRGSVEYSEGQNLNQRRHDYDVQSMETSLASPRAQVKNPIPAPSVTVRSEFPTLTRSRVQQSLTCLITVEIPEGKWRPTPEEARPTPFAPSGKASSRGGSRGDANSMRSPPASALPNPAGVYAAQASLDEATEELHAKVDNWHGLDSSRFGQLRLHSHIRVGKDRRAWQDLDCYLFSEMLICVKERKATRTPRQDGQSMDGEKTWCTLKGSILIKKHLKEVETFAGSWESVNLRYHTLTPL